MIFQKKMALNPVAITSPRHTIFSNMQEEIDGIRYYRTKLPDRLWSKLRDKVPFIRESALMTHFYKEIIKIAKKNSTSLIHAHSPSLCGIPGLKAAEKLGIPFVYEVRSLWEDSAVEQKKFSKRSVRYLLSRFIETTLLKRADAVTSISRGLIQEIQSRDISGEKLFIVPNGVDIEKFVPLEKDESLMERYRIDQGIVVGFIGSFFKGEGVDILIRAWPQIQKRYSNARLIIHAYPVVAHTSLFC